MRPTTITIEEARTKLHELIAQLALGEDVIITQNVQLVARLHLIAKEKLRSQLRNCQGMLAIIAEDEDHLEDCKDYMP